VEIPSDIICLKSLINTGIAMTEWMRSSGCAHLRGMSDIISFLVGGLVRDLLIYNMKVNPKTSSRFKSANIFNVFDKVICRNACLDIDIVLEGDAERFAELLRERSDVGYIPDSIKIYKKFRTASVKFLINKKFLKIDLASTRTEKYQNHGALPIVNINGASIAKDVIRRDFTINTLSLNINTGVLKDATCPLSLAEHSFLEVKDYAGGLSDILNKKIRVLHDLSFKEDPTRIIRAVKFEKRLGFNIEKHTKNLIKEAIEFGAIDNVSGKRIVAELKLLLNEKSSWMYFERLDKLSVLRAICSNLKFDNYTKSVFKKIHRIEMMYCLTNRFVVYGRQIAIGKENRNKDRLFIFYIAALLRHLSSIDFDVAVKRLSLDKKIKKIIESTYMEADNIYDIEKKNGVASYECDGFLKLKNSEIYLMFRNFSENGILFYLLENDNKTARSLNFKKWVIKYLNKIRFIEPVIDGNEVKSLGICEGPLCGAILEEIKLLKIDGRLKSRRAEILYIKNKYILNKKMEVLKDD